MDEQARDRFVATLEEDVAAGLPSVQAAVVRDGEALVDVTVGAPDTSRYVAMSVTKAVVAGLVAVLVDDGVLDPDQRVAEVVPAFDRAGFDEVTVGHVLLHTCGFPSAPMRPAEGADPARRAARLATWRLDREPGTSYAYHAGAAHWVLAELVWRWTSTSLQELLGSRVLAPLGLDGTSLGVPAPDVRPLVSVGDGVDTEGLARAGLDMDAGPDTDHERVLTMSDPEIVAAGVPGGGLVTTARDVAHYLQAWLDGAPAPWSDAVGADLRARVRNDLPDPLTGLPANRTLGLVLAGPGDEGSMRLFGAGRATSPATFGHPGVGGMVAWCDPVTRTSVCVLTDGIDADPIRTWTRATRASRRAAAIVAGREETA